MNQTAHLRMNLGSAVASLTVATSRAKLALDNYNAILETARNYAEDLVLVLEKSLAEKEAGSASAEAISKEIEALNAILNNKGHMPIPTPEYIRLESVTPLFSKPR